MNNKQIERIKRVSFQELSQDEKENFVSYFSNEEEFMALKNLYLGMENLVATKLSPDARVKEDLDKLYDQVFQQGKPKFNLLSFLYPPIKPLFLKPGIQIALASLCILIGVYFFNAFKKVDVNEAQPSLLAVNENKKPESQNKTDQNSKSLDDSEKIESLPTPDVEKNTKTLVSEQNTTSSARTTVVFNSNLNLESNFEDVVVSAAESNDEAEMLDEGYVWGRMKVEGAKIPSIQDNIQILDLLTPSY